MEKPTKDEPTFPAPILVGSGTNTDQAVDFLLAAVEWILREDDGGLQYPVEGEISNWIEQAAQKSIQAGVFAAQITTHRTVERDVLRQSLALNVDPRIEEEKRLAALLSDISSEDARRLTSALHSNEGEGVQAARAAIVEKLGNRVKEGMTPARAAALGAMVGSGRAARAAALCQLLYKADPNVLMNRARKGDVEAALRLIRVDRLFLTDSSTTKVIRQAEFQNDRAFFRKLATAVNYRPRLGWKKGCRLYLYILFAMAAPLPPLVKLQLRVDPDGTRFRSFPAFERFVQRCGKDFEHIQANSSTENGPASKPDNI
jgi:hypothetical protein